MESYQNLLKKIKDEGVYTMDRTGVGRHRIFGTQSRYDVSNGTLPVVTTRKVFTDAIIKELLWFISGSYNALELKEQGVKIWDAWTVTDKDVEAFAEKYSQGNEDAKKALIGYGAAFVGTIGEMYGAMWRNAPRGSVLEVWPDVPESDLPSDKLKVWKEEYAKFYEAHHDKNDVPPFEQYAKTMYYSTVDQLNELILNLKATPYSSRLIVSAWVPSLIPFERHGIKPQENVLLQRGALAPCHAMFQCFATPSEVEGGKPKLSLMMTQR